MSIRGRQRLVTTKCNRNYEVKQLVKRGEFNMRKLLSLILVLVLLAGIITGCAGGKSHTAVPSGADNQNEAEADPTQNAPAESSADSIEAAESGSDSGEGNGEYAGENISVTPPEGWEPADNSPHLAEYPKGKAVFGTLNSLVKRKA